MNCKKLKPPLNFLFYFLFLIPFSIPFPFHFPFHFPLHLQFHFYSIFIPFSIPFSIDVSIPFSIQFVILFYFPFHFFNPLPKFSIHCPFNFYIVSEILGQLGPIDAIVNRWFQFQNLMLRRYIWSPFLGIRKCK